MIKRFRRNFWLIATASVFLFLGLILTTINVVNFSLVASEADRQTAMLAENHGRFDEEQTGPSSQELPPAPPEGEQGLPPWEAEKQASFRYFTVSFDEAGTGSIVALHFNANTVNEAEAIAWATSLKGGSTTGWTRNDYRYRIHYEGTSQLVSVLDVSRELMPTRNVLYASIVGSIVGLLLTMGVLIPISKVLTKPLETSIAKQHRFVSDASHELKTPLTVISASAELLEMQYGKNEALETIQKQIRRLTEMVKNLNALAKMDEVDRIEGKQTVEMSLICNDILVGMEPAFKAKGINLNAIIEDGVLLSGDPAALKALVSLLLDNALKYGKTEVNIALAKKGNRVEISLDNDAEEIPEGSLDIYFERFYRADNARASIEGSGIGLSMAKEIVRAHNGRIVAFGKDGRFHIKAEL